MATANHPGLRDGVFGPGEIKAIAAAFDEICREMDIPLSAVAAREVIAACVIDLAREGLLDPTLLKQRVLGEVRAAQQLATDSKFDPPSMWR